MKSKYKKIKYTNTGVKAPVVTLMKSNPDLDRSDMIELKYPEMNILIQRVLKKTMYNKAESRVEIRNERNVLVSVIRVKDVINNVKILCENYYIFTKMFIYLGKNDGSKEEYEKYVEWDKIISYEFHSILYREIMEVLRYAKES